MGVAEGEEKEVGRERIGNDRPYFRNSIDELEILFEGNVKNQSVLSALHKEQLHRSRPRAKELAKKVKAILDAPYQLDLPIDIQTTGEYDRTASWYGTIGWYENRAEEFKDEFPRTSTYKSKTPSFEVSASMK